MGQRCPCSNDKINDNLTTMFSNEAVTNYEQELKAKSKKSLKVLSFDKAYYYRKLTYIRILQKYIIRRYYRNRVKKFLPHENSTLYKRLKSEYTTQILENTESELSSFVYRHNTKPKCMQFYCRILINYSDNYFYSGYVDINNKKNGKGFILKSDGSKFIGNWENDTLDGYGRIIDKQGNLYEGYFKQNKLNGVAKMVTFEQGFNLLRKLG